MIEQIADILETRAISMRKEVLHGPDWDIYDGMAKEAKLAISYELTYLASKIRALKDQ